jgi:hypothetical protein
MPPISKAAGGQTPQGRRHYKKRRAKPGSPEKLSFNLTELSWSCLIDGTNLRNRGQAVLDIIQFVHEFRTANTQIKDQSNDGENRVKNQRDTTTNDTGQGHAISRPRLFGLVHSQKTTDDSGQTKRNVRPAAASNGQRQNTEDQCDDRQCIRLATASLNLRRSRRRGLYGFCICDIIGPLGCSREMGEPEWRRSWKNGNNNGSLI